jgi:hypothetical protein
MLNCKLIGIVAPACLWLALSGVPKAGIPDVGPSVGNECKQSGQAVQLLQSPVFGLSKASSDMGQANTGIQGISSTLAKRFAQVDSGLRFLAENCHPFDLSIVVNEQACPSGAAQCECQVRSVQAPAPGSGLNSPPAWSNLSARDNERLMNTEEFPDPDYPVAVNILVSRNGVPVSGLGASAFRFSLAFAPFDGPTGLSGCGTQSFQDAGNGLYQIWLWPTGVSWVTGTYVGRLDTTDDQGFTVNTLIPIRIQ